MGLWQMKAHPLNSAPQLACSLVMPRIPKACWPAHLRANRCHPFLLLCHLGCHKLAQLFHGESCQGPSSCFDLLEDAGQLGPVKRRGLSHAHQPPTGRLLPWASG